MASDHDNNKVGTTQNAIKFLNFQNLNIMKGKRPLLKDNVVFTQVCNSFMKQERQGFNFNLNRIWKMASEKESRENRLLAFQISCNSLGESQLIIEFTTFSDFDLHFGLIWPLICFLYSIRWIHIPSTPNLNYQSCTQKSLHLWPLLSSHNLWPLLLLRWL